MNNEIKKIYNNAYEGCTKEYKTTTPQYLNFLKSLKVLDEIDFKDTTVGNSSIRYRCDVDYEIERDEREKSILSNPNNKVIVNNNGLNSIAACTGNYAAAVNSEDTSIAATTGYAAASINTGYWGLAVNTGDEGAAITTGREGIAVNTSTGRISASTGFKSMAVSNTCYTITNNTGDMSVAVGRGRGSYVQNSGNNSTSLGIGFFTHIVNRGSHSLAIGAGNNARSFVSGNDSIAIAAGAHCEAAGSIGSWLVLVERPIGESEIIKNIKAVKVDGIEIEANTYYHLVNGEVRVVKFMDKNGKWQKRRVVE